MADGEMPLYVRRVRAAAGRGAAASDAELLRRWAIDRDEPAFELLVYRHGPAVLAACRRVLGHTPDADDAFQAAFLALVRRADRIRDAAAVGGWLHRTAVRAALRAKAARPSRRLSTDPPASPDDRVERADLRAVLDQEIDRLPDRFRAPFVLCYLLGRTNEEAARTLGRPVGTVLSRLSTARAKLRAGLTRRGVAVPAAGLPLALPAPAFALPPELVSAAVRNATNPPPGLLALVPPESPPMLIAFCKPLALAVAVAAGLTIAGTGPADDPPKARANLRAEPPADPVAPPGWGVGAFSGYAGGLDPTTARTGKASGFLKRTGDGEQQFATLLQGVKAEPYRGKRIRLTGYIKTKAADVGASLWVRIDAPGATVGFDNMDDRKVAGTKDWTKCEIVLDVPKKATVITLGVLLRGAGTAWADDLKLEEVGKDVKPTADPFDNEADGAGDTEGATDKAENLDFEAAVEKEEKAAGPTADQVAWLKAHAVPFATDDPAAKADDLAPLKKVFADARIVALGEGTHGTREHFRMKHRLVAFLVRELGFTHFGIEASGPETERVNDYVLGGPGDAKAVVAGMLFWTWNTQEVVDLVEWLREHNKSAATKVRFLGFDVQYGKLAMEDTEAFVAAAAPEFAEQTKAAYKELAVYWDRGPVADKAFAAIPKDERAARAKKAWAVAEYLDSNRDKLAKGRSADEVARVIRTARVAAQAAEVRANGALRDKYMAANVKHVLDRAAAGSKMVLWAHNGHVCRQPNWMGAYLAETYGKTMSVVGFAAGEGTYTAVKPGSGLVSDNELLPPPAGSVEQAFRATGLPRAVLDLRAAAADPAGKWATDRRPFRSVGAVAMPIQFFPASVGDWYDVLVYFDRTEATKCFGVSRSK